MIKLLTELNSVFPHESKVLEIIWVGKRLNTKSTDFHFLKKHYFVWHSKDLWALEKLIIVSIRREGRSHLCGEVVIENKILRPPGTAHCCSALGRATFGKGAQTGCRSSSFFFFFLNPCIDVTLSSIHIPASMCWRRLLRVPLTTRRTNQSILKEINPKYSLERLMLKLQYFGHLMKRINLL